MTVVIGFVKPSGFEGVEDCPKFPVGFDGEGRELRTNWHSCQLILVDDDHYASDARIAPTTECDALIAQHYGSSNNWQNQHDWLSEMGWRPMRVDEFSHGGEYKFWKEVCDLLARVNPGERAEILKVMAERYDRVHTFVLLDGWAAYAVLANIDDGNDKEQRRRFQALPPSVRAEIPLGEDGNRPPLGTWLATADRIAGELLSD
jgi:hypothetical protein